MALSLQGNFSETAFLGIYLNGYPTTLGLGRWLENLIGGSAFNLAFVAVASGLLAGLLMAEKQRSTGPILIFKTPLPILFVAAELIQPHPVLFPF
jgi:hypothetical protein